MTILTMISNLCAEWEAAGHGGPERVAVSCCPLCDEAADKVLEKPDGQTWNWCEGCRLDWLDGPKGKQTLRVLGRRGKKG